MYDSETYPTCLCHVSLHHSVANPQDMERMGAYVSSAEWSECFVRVESFASDRIAVLPTWGSWSMEKWSPDTFSTCKSPNTSKYQLSPADRSTYSKQRLIQTISTLSIFVPNCSTSLCRPSTLASNLILIHIIIYICIILYDTYSFCLMPFGVKRREIWLAECRTLELVVLQDLKRSATLALRWKTCA